MQNPPWTLAHRFHLAGGRVSRRSRLMYIYTCRSTRSKCCAISLLVGRIPSSSVPSLRSLENAKMGTRNPALLVVAAEQTFDELTTPAIVYLLDDPIPESVTLKPTLTLKPSHRDNRSAPITHNRRKISHRVENDRRWKSIRDLDENEKWSERTSVVTKADHLVHLDYGKVMLIVSQRGPPVRVLRALIFYRSWLTILSTIYPVLGKQFIIVT